MSCGHEIVQQSLVVHEAGEMQEVILGKKKVADTRRHLWEQLCTYAAKHSPERRYGRARNLFRDLTGVEVPREWRFSTTSEPVTEALESRIKANNIRFARGRAKREGVAA